jgi:putative membrane protein insertion efficiency factor
MKLLVLKLLRGYKRLISPMLPAACKYVPTCSEYALEAVERFGILRGGAMAIWRVLRCNPFVKGGVDPVEELPTLSQKTRKDGAPLHNDCGAHGRRERLPRLV